MENDSKLNACTAPLSHLLLHDYKKRLLEVEVTMTERLIKGFRCTTVHRDRHGASVKSTQHWTA